MKSKILYAALALLLSIALWLVVVTVVNPEWEETFTDIPVVLENEEVLRANGYMLMQDENPKITLRLSGNRTDMIKLNKSNITIRVDLAKIYSAGEQRLEYDIIYPGDVASNAFNIISQTPQQITLNIVKRISKAVTVDLKISNLAEGFEAVADTKQIKIEGPADVVDRVVKAEATLDLSGQTTSFTYQLDYELLDAEGQEVVSPWLKATPQKVESKLTIQKIEDVSLSVDVQGGEFWTIENYTVKCYDQNDKEIEFPIRLTGSEIQMNAIKNDGYLREGTLVLGAIDLSQEALEPDEAGVVILEEEYDLATLLEFYELTTNKTRINNVRVEITATVKPVVTEDVGGEL